MSKKDMSQHPQELREDPVLLFELQRQAPTWKAKGAQGQQEQTKDVPKELVDGRVVRKGDPGEGGSCGISRLQYDHL